MPTELGGPHKPVQARSAQTKILRTRERVLQALEDLLREMPAVDITIAALCRHAGVSTDPLYSAHHAELRSLVERRLVDQVKAQAHQLPARRRRLPVSLTAEVKIAQLEQELVELKSKYQAAIQAVNVLSQVVETLTAKSSAASGEVMLLPTSKRSRGTPLAPNKR